MTISSNFYVNLNTTKLTTIIQSSNSTKPGTKIPRKPKKCTILSIYKEYQNGNDEYFIEKSATNPSLTNFPCS